MNTCINCKCKYDEWSCESCKKDIYDRCEECHNEVVHSIIVDQNIHICGGIKTGLDGLDKDPDAWKKANQN